MTGYILWVSERDKNGIIVDKNKNEYYFDISVSKDIFESLKRRDNVLFEHNTKITNCLCAINIKKMERVI